MIHELWRSGAELGHGNGGGFPGTPAGHRQGFCRDGVPPIASTRIVGETRIVVATNAMCSPHVPGTEGQHTIYPLGRLEVEAFAYDVTRPVLVAVVFPRHEPGHDASGRNDMNFTHLSRLSLAMVGSIRLFRTAASLTAIIGRWSHSRIGCS